MNATQKLSVLNSLIWGDSENWMDSTAWTFEWHPYTQPLS